MGIEKLKKANFRVKTVYSSTVQELRAEEEKMTKRLKSVKQKIDFG